MSPTCAPRAQRTPISRVRWATLNDKTPNSPTPATSNANMPNQASTMAYNRGFSRLVKGIGRILRLGGDRRGAVPAE